MNWERAIITTGERTAFEGRVPHPTPQFPLCLEVIEVLRTVWAAGPERSRETELGVSFIMPVRSGRLEKRIPLAVPVEIAALRDPSAAERASTENLCSLGVRVLAQQPKELNERLIIRSLVGDVRTLARVVYCQRLGDGRFGIGMQFLGNGAGWRVDLMGGAAD